MMFALMAGFLKVVLQLLLRVPPALPDGPHLLGAGCCVRMLVRAEVARGASADIAHTCIVPPCGLFRKRCIEPLSRLPLWDLQLH